MFIRLNSDANAVTNCHFWEICTFIDSGKEPILNFEIISIQVTDDMEIIVEMKKF